MSPELEFTALLDKWRRLTEEEGCAISAGNWAQVENFQSAKSLLQPRISEVRERIAPARHESQFRPIIDELIRLERRNQSLIDNRRKAAQEQERDLNRSDRNLRQIHKSYLPPARALWQSYS
jgi:hypothetical protein